MGFLELLKRNQGELSQAQYATLLGVSQGFLSKVLSGDRLPGLAVLRGFVAAFPEQRTEAWSSFFAEEYDRSQEVCEEATP